MISLTEQEKLLYGFSNSSLTDCDIGNQTIRLHHLVEQPLRQLLSRLEQEDLPVRIVSHWRSFDHQASIWLKKWTGQRPLRDRDGHPLDVAQLSDDQKLEALCFWSAIPGTSRHHWGTDFDLFLARPIEQGYQVELTQAEFKTGGPSELLGQWLATNEPVEGFSRPYRQFRGGVSVEPWHISYRPVADPLLNAMSHDRVAELLEQHPQLNASVLVPILRDYFENFLHNID